jgi:hypothetical protein
MNRSINKEIIIAISCLFLVLLFAGHAWTTEHGVEKGIQRPSVAALTTADHATLKQRVSTMRNSLNSLESRLDAMVKMPPPQREQAWKGVHDSVERLKADSLQMTEHMSSLKRKNLGKADWASLHQSTRNDTEVIKAKLKTVLKKCETLAKVEQSKEDIKATRSEIESKFKAGEQARNSDYNILISIVKTINEELGIFNKAMN